MNGRSKMRHGPRFDLLHPYSTAIFALLAAAWLLAWLYLDPHAAWLGNLPQWCGYVSAVALLIPFVHIARRYFLHRRWFGSLELWMQLHVASSYVALAAALVHSRAHWASFLTGAITVLMWTVIATGLAGHLIRTMLYRWLRNSIASEYGVVNLKKEYERLLSDGEKLEKKCLTLQQASSSKSNSESQSDGEAMMALCRLVTGRLKNPLTVARWLFVARATVDRARIIGNARQLVSAGNQKLVDEMEKMLQDLQDMETEYAVFHLAHGWLLLHAPAAWLLLVLVVAHIVSSMYYVGY